MHRYVKAVYFDAWDSRATADDPYVLAVSGDLARVSFRERLVRLLDQSKLIGDLYLRNSLARRT